MQSISQGSKIYVQTRSLVTWQTPVIGNSLKTSFSNFRRVSAVDLFASWANTQPPTYCSWEPDPAALIVDALSISWESQYSYMFPPFALISWCLNKLREKSNSNSDSVSLDKSSIVPSTIELDWFSNPPTEPHLDEHNTPYGNGGPSTSGHVACLSRSYCTDPTN